MEAELADEAGRHDAVGAGWGVRWGVLPFFKLHGLGNDYVFIDALRARGVEERFDLPELARRVSDRHTGVGSDGLILVCRATRSGKLAGAHARMRIFNADGSEAENCGNGLRCVAKLLHDELGVRREPLRIETGSGLVEANVRVALSGAHRGLATDAEVTMGEPSSSILGWPEMVNMKELVRAGHPYALGVHEHTLRVGGQDVRFALVGMGNPHAVAFVDGRAGHLRRCVIAREMAALLGPLVERHKAFPQRINAHFVAVDSRTKATMFTWERGSGLTQACGTGACAVLVAGVLTGRLDRRATLTLPGGKLGVSWSATTGLVHMTGPAEMSYRGVLEERLVPRLERAARGVQRREAGQE